MTNGAYSPILLHLLFHCVTILFQSPLNNDGGKPPSMIALCLVSDFHVVFATEIVKTSLYIPFFNITDHLVKFLN